MLALHLFLKDLAEIIDQQPPYGTSGGTSPCPRDRYASSCHRGAAGSPCGVRVTLQLAAYDEGIGQLEAPCVVRERRLRNKSPSLVVSVRTTSRSSHVEDPRPSLNACDDFPWAHAYKGSTSTSDSTLLEDTTPRVAALDILHIPSRDRAKLPRSAYPTWVTTFPFSDFLDLPAELRDEVYHFALVHNRHSKSKVTPALLCTPRPVYNDASCILYAQSTFSIEVSNFKLTGQDDTCIKLEGDVRHSESRFRSGSRITKSLPPRIAEMHNIHLDFRCWPYPSEPVQLSDGTKSVVHKFLIPTTVHDDDTGCITT